MENNACISQPTDWSAAPSVAEAGPHSAILPDTERALLDRVALQDQHAFAMLYARYAAPVRRYLLRCLSQADLVDDVLQEVMLVLWQRPSACPPAVSLTAWLCGIARHKARKAMTRAATPPALPRPPLDSDVDDPAHVVLDQDPPAVWPVPWTHCRSTNGPHCGCSCTRAVRIRTLPRRWTPPSARCAPESRAPVTGSARTSWPSSSKCPETHHDGVSQHVSQVVVASIHSNSPRCSSSAVS